MIAELCSFLVNGAQSELNIFAAQNEYNLILPFDLEAEIKWPPGQVGHRLSMADRQKQICGSKPSGIIASCVFAPDLLSWHILLNDAQRLTVNLEALI